MSVRTSLLPAGLTLVGSIEGKGDLVVAGSVDGPIELDGELTIEAEASVRGDVRATTILVRGMLVGNAVAKASVRAEPSATVVGDVTAPRVSIARGAKVRGRVTMSGEPVARARQSSDRQSPDRQSSRAPSRGAPSSKRSNRASSERASSERGAERQKSRRRRRPDRGTRRSKAEERSAEPVPAATAPDSPSESAKPRRRKRRRTVRKPPPPTIPAVQRQTARRKDRAVEPT